MTDGVIVSLVSPWPWRVNKYLETGGGNFEHYCNFLYFNQQANRNLLIILYIYVTMASIDSAHTNNVVLCTRFRQTVTFTVLHISKS
jgi:hypothetical protein